MEITYQHANPNAGNESFLVRIQDGTRAQTPCILVDAGNDVAIDERLADDEYLAAILLTHAHVDHYRSLGDVHRNGVPILTSPGTAAILPAVFAEGKRHYGLSGTESLLDHVEPVEDWCDVVDDTVSVRSVPAGHAPGACGFALRIGDGDDPVRMLVTGDFTLRDAAGYPGLEPDAYHGFDTVFLTASTRTEDDADLTDVVGQLARRAKEGSTTLCSTSGLTGVHVAALLGAVENEFDRSVPVVLAGHVAKLYDRLCYDHPNVRLVPEFRDPSDCLDAGTVTIAGPEVPVEGSSSKLFEAMRDDPNATLVQIQGGSTNAKDASDASGTVTSTTFSNHPPQSALDEVVETVEPAHVVVTHQQGIAKEQYKDKWNAYTWATGNGREQTLYAEDSISAPPWVGSGTERRVRKRSRSGTILASNAGLLDELSLPDVGRRDQIDLEDEGIDQDRLSERLELGRPSPEDAAPQPVTVADGASESESPTQRGIADGGLYRTAGPQTEGVRDEPPLYDPDEQPVDPDTLFETVPPPSADLLAETATVSTDESGGGADQQNREAVVSTEETPNSVPDSKTEDESETDETAREDPSSEEAVVESSDESTPQQTSEQSGDEGPTTATAGEPASDAIEVPPLLLELADKRATELGVPLGSFVRSAVVELLESILRGEPFEAGGEAPLLTVEAEPAVERLFEDATPDESPGLSTFVREQLYDVFGTGSDENTVRCDDLEQLSSLLEAVVANDDYPPENRDEVIHAAIERRVLE